MENQKAQLKELLDKEAIRDIRSRWGEALDNKNWAQFESLFTDDIDTDFTAWGIPPQKISKSNFVAMFSQQSFRNAALITQHLYANFRITIENDTATSVCNFIGQHHIPNFEGGAEYILKGEYTDGLIKTKEGWKINKLTFRQFYATGNAAILA
jgi:SnoaL-like domain